MAAHRRPIRIPPALRIVSEAEFNRVIELDEHGNPIVELDEHGNPIDAGGNVQMAGTPQHGLPFHGPLNGGLPMPGPLVHGITYTRGPWIPLRPNNPTPGVPRSGEIVRAKPVTPYFPLWPFRFGDLPAEVRNKIYELVLVSEQESINLSANEHISGGIETAILCTSKKIYKEASTILYNNKFAVHYNEWLEGTPLRQDIHASENGGRIPHNCTLSRDRFGNVIPGEGYIGTVYRHIFERFRRVDFFLTLFDRHRDPRFFPKMDTMVLFQFHENLRNIYSIIEERTYRGNQQWTMVITNHSEVPARVLGDTLAPVLSDIFYDAVAKKQLTVRLVGMFPRGSGNVFERFLGLENFHFEEVKDELPYVYEISDRELNRCPMWTYRDLWYEPESEPVTVWTAN
ncbi:hypothetical protein F5884DRAFT_855033 [Xylogone sp. PMI_703]|nr:hypothetical protein F5884DRAFT_855033 [Xylogone sp. PMI_703]